MTAQRCPSHRNRPPAAPARPFRIDPQPYTCKGCGARLGTQDEAVHHYCPCCGERLESCIRNGSSSCPQCGRIGRDGEFVPEVDHLVELLTGRGRADHQELAASAFRRVMGERVAHYARWVHQDAGHTHGVLARGSSRVDIRVQVEAGLVEAATPCGRDGCRGKVWSTVTGTAQLLAVYQRDPRLPGTCDRCDRRPTA
ncbi:hypothetical protein OG618_37905 (plasmid) [Kitasatospora sp. NBC_01246]|uniref:hypothetical protein n=1 Tax=Kitasatospora sp. NBC_01246 TaxID=2903570 RepID=UPI002E311651|nr:hypothetical protein [Kitasatospora sp. NBC_01246]